MMSQFVLGFVVDPDSRQILLMRREKPDAWAGKWNGISGAVAQGETPLDAMVRKAQEECGLVTQPGQWTEKATLQTVAGEVVVFLCYTNIYVARQMRDNKPIFYHATAHWEREPVIPDLRWLIPLVLSPDIFSPPVVRHQ